MALAPGLLELHVPWLWEGAEAGWSRPQEVGFLLAAVGEALLRHPSGDDEDRALVRGSVSLDADQRDRVRLSLPQPPEGLRSALRNAPASGERSWSALLRPTAVDWTRAFDVDWAEMHARCLPHYEGFLHAWTDAATVRSRLLHWPEARRQEFAHEYLLYAANDARFAASHGGTPDAALQEAARWLRSRRRHLLRWQVEREEAPAAPLAPAALHGALRGALSAFAMQAGREPSLQWLTGHIEEAVVGFEQATAPGPLGELLERMEAPAWLARRAAGVAVVGRLLSSVGEQFEGEPGQAARALAEALAASRTSGW